MPKTKSSHVVSGKSLNHLDSGRKDVDSTANNNGVDVNTYNKGSKVIPGTNYSVDLDSPARSKSTLRKS